MDTSIKKPNSLKTLQVALLDHALMRGALKFSDFAFKLKSFRMSPYFFNSGTMSDGKGLDIIGRAYAAAICAAGLEFNMLFGPAYKGIPLISATAASLWQHHDLNIGFAYNRKEPKDHGEGGLLVGDSIKNQRLVIIDDVISAGTAVKESFQIIRDESDGTATVVGIAMMLDRQEKGSGNLSAVQEVQQMYGIPVVSILKLDDIISHIEASEPVIEGSSSPDSAWAHARDYVDHVRRYREQYGVS